MFFEIGNQKKKTIFQIRKANLKIYLSKCRVTLNVVIFHVKSLLMILRRLRSLIFVCSRDGSRLQKPPDCAILSQSRRESTSSPYFLSCNLPKSRLLRILVKYILWEGEKDILCHKKKKMKNLSEFKTHQQWKLP